MTWTILQADARQIPLRSNSVQCVVTSPPYWGLRDYGTATWVGGDEGCDHANGRQGATRRDVSPERLAERAVLYGTGTGSGSDVPPQQYRNKCPKCGATRIDSQIGLEKSPEEYVAKIVAVFREVWRVLRDDGTVWCNLGDSYNAGRNGGHAGGLNGVSRPEIAPKQSGVNAPGLKPKDLVGIPWRVAFALQADGWYLRSDIIWSKPNPMPESVTDRPTKAHEYIFLLTKKPNYYFDQDAVREEAQPESYGRYLYAYGGAKAEELTRTGQRQDGFNAWRNPTGRNIRTVWEIATQPFPNAHFATFPEEIALRCIKAGTSEKGACKECGAPWDRVTSKPSGGIDGDWHQWRTTEDGFTNTKPSGQKAWDSYNPGQTLGWQPTCKHDAPTVPCVVLDPFSGAGTVPLVADKLNRRGIGLELKADYCRMASNRCYDDAPLLAGY